MPHLYLSEAEALWLYQLIDDGIAKSMYRSYAGIELSETDQGTEEMGEDLIERLRPMAIEYSPEHTDRKCKNCFAVLTSPNPRKTTCSDVCRQALSRANRARTEMIKAVVKKEMRIAALKAEESAQSTATANPLQ